MAVRSVDPVKCERVDVGEVFCMMRLEYADGGCSWYRATMTGFKNIHEVEQAEEVERLEADYLQYWEGRCKHEPKEDEGSHHD